MLFTESTTTEDELIKSWLFFTFVCLLFVLCLQKGVIEGLKSKKLWYPLPRAQAPRLSFCVAVYNCWSRCSTFWGNWVTVSICPGFPGHSWSLYWPPVPKTRSSDHCWMLFAIVWRAWPEAIRELWDFQNWVKCPPAPLALTSRLARAWSASLAFISHFLRNSRTCHGWMCLLKGIALWEPWSLARIRSIIIENEIKFSWKNISKPRMVCHGYLQMTDPPLYQTWPVIMATALWSWLLSVCRYSSQNPNILATILSLVPVPLTMAPDLLLCIPCMLMFWWLLSSSPSNV